jgi:hypothetical protein
MSPLEDIRNGIDQKDWSLVIRGYSTLTGESIDTPKAKAKAKPPKVKTKSPKPVKLITDVESLPEPEPKPDPFEKFRVKNNPPQSSDKKQARVESWTPPTRTDFEKLPERNSEKKYIAQDKALIKSIAKKNRPEPREPFRPHTKVSAECVVCNSKFEAYPFDLRREVGDGPDTSKLTGVCEPCMHRARRS